MTIQTVSLNISHGGMQGGLARFSDLLVDYGDVDPFLAEQLRPELLQGACEKANIPSSSPTALYSYYFISTLWAIICAGMPRV